MAGNTRSDPAMNRWALGQVEAFKTSYVVEETLAKTHPKALVIPLLVGIAFTLLPAWIEPLASSVQFRRPWVATLIALAAVGMSFGFHRVRGAPPWGPVFTWLDTSLYVSAIAWCVGSTAPPASHAYAIILGLMLAAGQSRDYSLTLLYAIATCVPAMAIVVALRAGLPDILIVAFSITLSLWISQDTGAKRELSRRNASLRAALLSQEEAIDRSMDIALTSATVGIGHFLHELRNAQTVLAANLRFLAECGERDDACKQALGEMVAEQQRVQTLVDEEMRSLRARTAVKREAFDVFGLLQDAAGGSQLPCELRLPPQPFYATGDPSHLSEVMRVLLNNAREAGARSVSVRSTIDPGGGFAEVEVRDDGPGIPPTALASMFKPFSTHGKKHGTGLGLYLARRSLQLMGGSLRGANCEGAGAVFHLIIPGSTRPASRHPSGETETQNADN